MAGYIGTQAVSVNTTSATISDDLAVGDDATVAGDATVTGVITGSTLEATGDTAAGDNAAIGYTAAEGLILTGQGSTGDITIKNDADAMVLQVPTGTTNVNVTGVLTTGDHVGVDTATKHDGSAFSSALTISGGSTSGSIFQGFRTANSLFELSMSSAGRSYFQSTGAQSQIHLQTGTTVGSATTKMTIEANGDALINDGNLVIGTDGHGIDFSADTTDNTNSTDELLDDYEEGTFQMTLGQKSGDVFGLGRYIKIGHLVHFQWYTGGAITADEGAGNATFTGLPFTSDSSNSYPTFSAHHNTYCPTSSGGYILSNSTSARFTANGATAIAAVATASGRYVMLSGTYRSTA